VPKPKRQNTPQTPRAGLPKIVPKAVVYDALAKFNRDVEQVLLDLERLGTLGLFPRRWQRKFLKTCRATLEETRAWANFELLEVLHAREEQEWVHFARLRQRAEKQSESPDDVSSSSKPGPRKSAKGRRK
jgi:hypothetical protein